MNGWSIDNSILYKSAAGTDNWVSDTSTLKIRLKGIVTPLPTVTIAPKTNTNPVTEGNAAVFTVTRTGATTDALTVKLHVDDAANSDFVASSNEGDKTVTIPVGSLTADYSVATVGGSGETSDEPNGDVKVTVLADASKYTVGLSSSAVRGVNDNDATVVSLARLGSSGAVEEGNKVEFTVSLDRRLRVVGSTAEITPVPLVISGTGVSSSDWSLVRKSGSSLNSGVTYRTGSPCSATAPCVRFTGHASNTVQTATLELTLTDDSSAESGGETMEVALGPDGTGTNGFDRTALGTNVGGGAVPSGTASKRSFSSKVYDPGTAPAQVTIGPKAATAVTEGTAAVFTVTRTGATTNALTVKLRVDDAANSDFVPTANEGNKEVTIAAGSSTADYSVSTSGDTTDEPNGDGDGAYGRVLHSGFPSSAVRTVNDDDATVVSLGGAMVVPSSRVEPSPSWWVLVGACTTVRRSPSP